MKKISRIYYEHEYLVRAVHELYFNVTILKEKLHDNYLNN